MRRQMFCLRERDGGIGIGMSTLEDIDSGQVWKEGQTAKAEMVRSCEMSG